MDSLNLPWRKPRDPYNQQKAIQTLGEAFGEFGYPRRLISDQGLAFTSKAFTSFMAEKGVRHIRNAIATPRANGQVERANKTILEALATGAKEKCRWDEKLPDIIWGTSSTRDFVRVDLDKINELVIYC